MSRIRSGLGLSLCHIRTSSTGAEIKELSLKLREPLSMWGVFQWLEETTWGGYQTIYIEGLFRRLDYVIMFPWGNYLHHRLSQWILRPRYRLIIQILWYLSHHNSNAISLQIRMRIFSWTSTWLQTCHAGSRVSHWASHHLLLQLYVEQLQRKPSWATVISQIIFDTLARFAK